VVEQDQELPTRPILFVLTPAKSTEGSHACLTSSSCQSAAREKVLCGASLFAYAVRVTLEPKSKSVLIQKNRRAPIVCNDGVTKPFLR
jgi:hypothetical protein